jgi:hypothetical protein
MKANVGGIQVEGTPAEIAELHRALQDSPKSGISPAEILISESSQKTPITEAFAMRVLQRKPLSEAQQKMLSKLASKHPKWTSFEELQKATGYTPAQLSGALGALSRRVALTPGYVEGMMFLCWDWDESASSYNYFLSDASVAAAKRAGL